MSLITVKNKGNFEKTYKLFHFRKRWSIEQFKRFGELGVLALSSATPKDTGLTSESWYYEIEIQNGTITIRWLNNNFSEGWAPVAVLLQYGHATRSGGWVEGVDYINPALAPIFEYIAEEAWKEVVR